MAANKRPVIICTEHRGVFFGYTDKPSLDVVSEKVVSLADARMAIQFGKDRRRGVVDLANTGPDGRVSTPADITLNAVTAVFEVTEAAEKAWLSL